MLKRAHSLFSTTIRLFPYDLLDREMWKFRTTNRWAPRWLVCSHSEHSFVVLRGVFLRPRLPNSEQPFLFRVSRYVKLTFGPLYRPLVKERTANSEQPPPSEPRTPSNLLRFRQNIHTAMAGEALFPEKIMAEPYIFELIFVFDAPSDAAWGWDGI